MVENPQIRYDRDEQLVNDPTLDESVRQQARIRQVFWQARFIKKRKSDFIADSFIGLWVNLVIIGNNPHIFGGKHLISKEVEKFYMQPKLQEAIRQAGDAADRVWLDELTDSARIYLIGCKTDSNYGSSLLGFARLKEKDVARKTARDAAYKVLAPLVSVSRTFGSDLMMQAVWQAWQLVFADFPLMLEERVRELNADISRKIMEIVADVNVGIPAP
jgi:hypothetical protein